MRTKILLQPPRCPRPLPPQLENPMDKAVVPTPNAKAVNAATQPVNLPITSARSKCHPLLPLSSSLHEPVRVGVDLFGQLLL